MFYITKKDSETGRKFTEVIISKDRAIKEQKAFAEKYGFRTFRAACWQAWGGISSCLDFKETPDKKIWGKGLKKGEYYPRQNSKSGKDIYKEIENLHCVSIDVLNQCIGFDGAPFKQIGFASCNKQYFGFVVDKKWKIKVPKDCEEVLESKYDLLFQS